MDFRCINASLGKKSIATFTKFLSNQRKNVAYIVNHVEILLHNHFLGCIEIAKSLGTKFFIPSNIIFYPFVQWYKSFFAGSIENFISRNILFYYWNWRTFRLWMQLRHWSIKMFNLSGTLILFYLFFCFSIPFFFFQEYNKDSCSCVCRNQNEENECYYQFETKLWVEESCQCACKPELYRQCSTGYIFDNINTCE